MYFVFSLPRTRKGHDGIWVIVDRLTKSAHFLPVGKKYTLDKLMELYVKEIMRFYGVPESIVSDRDARFSSKFWGALQAALVQGELTYEEEPVQILDLKEQVLMNKTIPLVKVLWRSHQVEEATWESEVQMRQQYPYLFD
ncbi:hypothetical protein ACLB2K_037503 [Fragaria x ananassa]